MKDGNSSNDGRIALLERLQANARFTRTSKKSDPATAQLACELENYFAQRINELKAVVPALPGKETVAA